MADMTLSDGREIEFDWYKLTLEEYENLFNKENGREYENEIIARVSGLDIGEYKKLPYADYKKLAQRFYKKAKDPAADPS